MKIELNRLITNTTLDEQRQKVLSEAIELTTASTSSEISAEASDVLQVILSFLDLYADETLISAFEKHNKKINSRGWKMKGKWIIERVCE